MEIWRKSRVETKQNITVIIKKLHDENDELKGSTTRLKPHEEELQDLRQKVEIWETMEKKMDRGIIFS